MRYGIGTYIKQLVGALSEFPDIKIILVNFHSCKYKEFVSFDISERYSELHIPSPRFLSYSNSKEEKYAARIVDLLDPLICISDSNVFQINYFDALPIARTLNSKYIFPVLSIIHSAQWQFLFDGNKQRFIEKWSDKKDSQKKEFIPIMEEKELYELSDMVISVTDYMKEFIIKYYGIHEDRIQVIHNGIDNAVFHNPSKKERSELKHNLGFSPEEKIILFSGRLDASKGIYFLLDAFAKVVKKFDKIRLVLVGDDSGPDKIHQYLAQCTNMWGKVTFTGFLKYEQILEFYQIADIGIIPSIYDHGTYVALEMIGHNLPLIVSNAQGFDEFLTDRQCIFLNQIIDEEGNISYSKSDFAEAILTLLFDKKLAKSVTRDYNNLIMYKLSSKRMGSEYYALIKNINHMVNKRVITKQSVQEYS